jgi:hypothetical protein
MRSKNAERLAKYRAKMQAAGFERMSFYGCPELVAFLREERRPSECYGRVLERLLLGQSAPRPEYWTPEERQQRLVGRGHTGGGKP